jgi:hypothetical protein
MVKIDKGIPLPDPPMPHRDKWPWKLLERGDSFLAKGTEECLRSIRSQASFHGRQLGRSFTVRKLRLWRGKEPCAARVYRVK